MLMCNFYHKVWIRTALLRWIMAAWISSKTAWPQWRLGAYAGWSSQVALLWQNYFHMGLSSEQVQTEMWWLGKSEIIDAQTKSLHCSIFFLGVNWENPQTQSSCHSAGQHGMNELVCFRLLPDLFKPKCWLQRQKFLLVNSEYGQW